MNDADEIAQIDPREYHSEESMGVMGDPSGWEDTFPDRLIPDIIDLVIGGWEHFDKPLPTTSRKCLSPGDSRYSWCKTRS